jgi:anti-anti-sigma regulatory factor
MLRRLRSLATTQIILVSGSVGHDDARRLERWVAGGVARGSTRVVIDLREVIDVVPGFLGVLVDIREEVSRVGGRVSLVVTGPPMEELVGAADPSGRFAVAPDLATAFGAACRSPVVT